MQNVALVVVAAGCLNIVACADAEVKQADEASLIPAFSVEGSDVFVDAGLTVDANEVAGVIETTNTWIGYDIQTQWSSIDYSRVRIFVHADGAPILQDECDNCAGYTETVKHVGAPDTFDVHVKQFYTCMGHSVLDHELLHVLSHMNGQDGDGTHSSVHVWHELQATIHIHSEILCGDASLAPTTHTKNAGSIR